jgi:hypothetical protein
MTLVRRCVKTAHLPELGALHIFSLFGGSTFHEVSLVAAGCHAFEVCFGHDSELEGTPVSCYIA